MPSQPKHQEPSSQEKYLLAEKLLKAGTLPQDVIAKLGNEGVEQQTAKKIVNDLLILHGDPLRRAGKRNMLIGIILAVAGAGLSFTIKLSPDTNVTLALEGSILLGIGIFLRGVSQYFAKKKTKELAEMQMKKELFGAENPEETWVCPNCNSTNPNTTYTCKNCNFRLN